jgi:hypothetical protein
VNDAEQTALNVAKTILALVGTAFGGPVGTTFSVVSQLLPPVYAAIEGGGSPGEIVKVACDAIVAASDAQMKRELGA